MDEDSKWFKRFFAYFYACIHGFKYCRPMLFVDGTFLKSKYKGQLLAATAKDGNQVVIIDSETEDNWRWFFENLLEIVGDDRQITVISDRNNVLKSVLPKVFPTAYYAYCLHHLKINLRDKVRGHKSYKECIVYLFHECTYAPTKYKFQDKLSDLLLEGKEQVGYFLNDCPFQCWANAYFQGQRYGEMCLNVAESFNAWIKEARFLPITNLVDMIRSQIMGQMCTRRLEASSWNIVLCSKIDERLGKELDKRRTWRVSMLSDRAFEVHSHLSVTVDIGVGMCTCCQWQLNGFPCSHAIVAIQSSGGDINDYVEDYFTLLIFRHLIRRPFSPFQRP
ncbi:hypothetical protein L1049_008349 [Liquidambar formosana]|uniref:SWIM-type domain-containing protein n=1 Tax=Liquidambar formosana TaxID=63359 RepID=A0AAP0X883_LIQFO